MKGIVRKVDELGRIVIPIEMRRVLDIEEDTELEIWVRNRTICLTKPTTTVCANCESINEDTDSYCYHCGNFLLDEIGGVLNAR